MDTTEAEAAQVVALLQQGLSQRVVARRLNLSRSAVRRVYQRFLETGQYRRRSGSGRHRVTTQRDDRFLVVSALRNRHLSGVDLQRRLREDRGVAISDSTVRRRLREQNLRPYKPATGPQLTTAHRQARLRFARDHVNWTIAQWESVLFSDESRMTLYGSDGRRNVMRRPGERYSQCCIRETVSYGGGSVMFWGGISLTGRTELVFIRRGALTAARYITEILEDHVVPYAGYIGENFELMHDNARPHVARITTDYLEEVGIRVMSWPARSPDLNPIEHMWDTLKQKVRARNPVPTTLGELETAIREEWNRIPQETIKVLIRSLKRRMQAVIRARGGNTPY